MDRRPVARAIDHSQMPTKQDHALVAGGDRHREPGRVRGSAPGLGRRMTDLLPSGAGAWREFGRHALSKVHDRFHSEAYPNRAIALATIRSSGSRRAAVMGF